ncbi:MAG: hypothetical protein HY812_12435 [Planctomycetes bacterium]|nr:hypothetical protein [Planctomycetota bacterium]
MNSTEPAVTTGSSTNESLHDAVARECRRLEGEMEERKRALKVLKPLAREGSIARPEDLARKAKALRGFAAGEAHRGLQLDALLRLVDDWERDRANRLRRILAQEIKTQCDAAGVALRVVSKDGPIELRLDPLAVILDLDKGKASLCFAKVELGKCAADAAEILKTWKKVRTELERPFDAARFFAACRKTYLAALSASGGHDGDRVEILEILPHLALEMQERKFRANPVARNFRSYGKAHCAFDVWRLRQTQGLTQNGLRVNFGVASGATPYQKERVVYLEGPDGQDGQYTLTIFFTRA